jgi:hypothetical protein
MREIVWIVWEGSGDVPGISRGEGCGKGGVEREIIEFEGYVN